MKVFDRNRLKVLRLEKKYSMGMMAMLMKARSNLVVSRSAISKWERGQAAPCLVSLAALSELFNVPMDYFLASETNCLFGRNQPKPPAAQAPSAQEDQAPAKSAYLKPQASRLTPQASPLTPQVSRLTPLPSSLKSQASRLTPHASSLDDSGREES